MAWRGVGKKGLNASLIRALASAPVGLSAGLNSSSTFDLAVKSLSASFKCVPGKLSHPYLSRHALACLMCQ
uniref:Uncharacterized protein n=1 Tax=Gossypium raimondii TaxID=29730 RepID=A0A0D2QSD3_GOSRA|nr:hypothetical protein B456_004G054000 [Gossypium raimondii]